LIYFVIFKKKTITISIYIYIVKINKKIKRPLYDQHYAFLRVCLYAVWNILYYQPINHNAWLLWLYR